MNCTAVCVSSPVCVAVLLAALAVPVAAAAQTPIFIDVTDQWIPPSLAADDWEKDISVADLDLDGDLDVVVVRKKPWSNRGAASDLVLLNEGGTLVSFADLAGPGWPMNQPSDARDVFVGDFTGNGFPDIVIITTFDDPLRFYRNLGLDPAGAWAGLAEENSRMPNLPDQQFCAGWGGDVDGDQDLDLYMSGYGGTPDVLFIQQSDGSFNNESIPRIGEVAVDMRFGTSAEMHDLDSDGDLDIVFNKTLTGTPEVAVLFNDGTGHFTRGGSAYKQILASGLPYMFTVGDLDTDGDLDFYIVDDGFDRVLLTQSTVADDPIPISFVDNPPLNQPRTAGFGGNVKFGDADEDGDLDVGVSAVDVDSPGCDREFALLLNDGSGTLQDPFAAEPFHISNYDFAFVDLDTDGCQEILMGVCPAGYRVFSLDRCPACDVNDDGAVDVVDALLALRMAAGKIPPPTDLAMMTRVDVAPPLAPDGQITAADAMLILRGASGAGGICAVAAAQ